MHFPAFHHPEQTWGTKRSRWNKVLQGSWLLAALSLSKHKAPGDVPDVCDLCLLWSHFLLSVLTSEERQQKWGTESLILSILMWHKSRWRVSRDGGHWVTGFLEGHQTPPSLHFGVYSSLKMVSNPTLAFLPFQSTFASIHHLATKKSTKEQSL